MKVKAILTVLLTSFAILTAAAQQRALWQEADLPAEISPERKIVPEKARAISMDRAGLAAYLQQAPMESPDGLHGGGLLLHLPTPDGGEEAFRVFQAPIMARGLARQFPQIKTFNGFSTKDARRYLRMDLTPKGFHAMVMAGEETYFIDPLYHDDRQSSLHQAYFKADYASAEAFVCEVEGHHQLGRAGGRTQAAVVGEELRVYRLAVAATGEYTQYHGGTVEDAMAAIVTTMNRVNGVYETDISARMMLIDSNQLIVYTDAGADPYSGSSGNHLGQNQTNLDAVIGNDNYDIGHVFHQAGGGGVAFLRSLCNPNNKARGFTSQSNPVADPFDIDYVAHEIGHQFGANHTQNNNCNRVQETAMEPGSASTIMGYAGICAPNLQNNSDAYFHAVSQEEMIDHTVFGGANGCAEKLPTGNTPPVVEAGENGLFLPVLTPFELTGTATDLEGDSLTFCWEQYDVGPSAPPNQPQGNSPIFRSFFPTADSTRVFPRLQDLVNSTTTIGEHLPDYNRGLRFRLTVRDNHGFGTGIAFDDRTFNVTEQGGPFLVTSQQTAETWTGGSLQTITWQVAGTDVAPVGAPAVDVFLSVDGGFTYPFQLADSIPNTGSALIVVPDTLETAQARVKVKGHGHVFFNINSQDIAIEAPAAPGIAAVAQTAMATVCAGSTADFTLQAVPVLGFDQPVQVSVEGLPAAFTASFEPEITLPASLELSIAVPTGLESGNYPFSVILSGGEEVADTVDLSLAYFSGAPAAPLLLGPLTGSEDVAVTPELTWEMLPEAESYDLDIAMDAGFTDIVLSETGLTGNIYNVENALPDSTLVFWRVRGQSSACGAGPYGTGAFATEIVRCEIFQPENLPISLDNTGSIITSVISVEIDRPVRDVNILNLTGGANPLSGLDFRFRGTNNEFIDLLTENCSSGFVFDFSLDDAAGADIPCPPTGGNSYRPEDPLSVFQGASTAGNWRLILFKSGNVSGSISNWELELCYSVDRATAVAEPQVLAERSLVVAPNPSLGDISLSWAGQPAPGQPAQVQLLNLNGQIVHQAAWAAGQSAMQMDVQALPAGLYIVQVQAAGGQLLGVSKVVKQ